MPGFVTHHDCSRHDTGWGHVEHQGRLPAVARAVYREMLTLHAVLREVEGVPVDVETLRLAHSAGYVERVREAVAAAEAAGSPQEFEHGTRLSGASWDAVTAAAGCVVTAVDAVIDGDDARAFCSVRPPGSGAHRNRAGDHSIFNNVAIAARHLRVRRGARRILVVEVGERFGAGTADIAARDDGILYLSAHAASNPADATGPAIHSVPLAPGAGCEEMIEGLSTGAAALLRGEDADLVLVSLGLDVLASDPHGTLGLEPADLHPLTRWMTGLADRTAGGRLVSALERGFDPAASGRAVVHHLRALGDLPA